MDVSVPDVVAERLAELAGWTEQTEAQAVRDAIGVRHFLECEVRGGGSVIVERPGGGRVVVVLTGCTGCGE